MPEQSGGDATYTVHEVAERLNVRDEEVRVWLKDGELKAVESRADVSEPRIAAAEVERFIDAAEHIQDDGQIQTGADVELTPYAPESSHH